MVYGLKTINSFRFNILFIKGCELPEIAFSTTNSTRIVPRNTVVKFKCNLYYEAEGDTVRKCVNRRLLPSFETNPLKCASKLVDLHELVIIVKNNFFIVLKFCFSFAALKKILGKQMLERFLIFGSWFVKRAKKKTFLTLITSNKF